MTAFAWTMLVLVGVELLTQAYRISTGRPAPQLTVGERVVVLLLDVGLIVWGLSILGVL